MTLFWASLRVPSIDLWNCRDYQRIIGEYSSPKEGSQPLHFDSPYALNLFGQYRLLTWRYMATYWRTTEYNAVRYALTSCL